MKPPRRRKIKAEAKQTARVLDKREREVRRVDRTTVHELLVSPGEAVCSIGHSSKWGASDKSSWMTVESSCYVSLHCHGSAKSIEEASDVASKLAYRLMHKNAEKVQADLDEYLEGGK